MELTYAQKKNIYDGLVEIFCSNKNEVLIKIMKEGERDLDKIGFCNVLYDSCEDAKNIIDQHSRYGRAMLYFKANILQQIGIIKPDNVSYYYLWFNSYEKRVEVLKSLKHLYKEEA